MGGDLEQLWKTPAEAMLEGAGLQERAGARHVVSKLGRKVLAPVPTDI